VAVGEFLGRRIGFLDIARTVERTLNVFARDTNGRVPAALDEVLALDGLARVRAREACGVLAA
jgi:1-deoxy-D-xylulose-5-phosphate reductoisomerase